LHPFICSFIHSLPFFCSLDSSSPFTYSIPFIPHDLRASSRNDPLRTERYASEPEDPSRPFVLTRLCRALPFFHSSVLDGGVFLEDYHCDRMLSSAKVLAETYAMHKEKFLQELIPTRSELVRKLEGAIKNGGKNNRQRVKHLDFLSDPWFSF